MNKKTVITICLGSSCYRRGNQAILELIKDYLAKHHLTEKVEFKGHLCTGNCTIGPNLRINNKQYTGLDVHAVIDILNKHFLREQATA